MNTITVTCPAGGEEFVVVEPKEPPTHGSLTATCPTCDESFAIVYPDELREPSSDRSVYEPFLAGVEEWEQKEDAPAPYTGSQEAIPYAQYITAKIGGLGGAPIEQEMGPSHEEALKPDRFQMWYTPEHDEISYVVRADFETGVKTKNVYSSPDGGLFIKNRGVPRDSDKQWTYLDRDECYARAAQAQLSGEIAEIDDNRYNIFLENREESLVSDDGELAEELVCELAQMLAAFQTKRVK